MPTVDNIGDDTLIVPHADVVESNETNTERLAQNRTVLVNIIEVLANSVPHWDENMQYSPIEYTQLLIDLLALPEAAELIGEITQEQIDELKTLLSSVDGAALIGTIEGKTVQESLDEKASIETLASNEGASTIGTSTGLTVEEVISLGRIVYPEMYGVGLSSPTDDELFTSMFLALEAKDDTLLGTSLLYTIDLRGKVYTLLESHSLDINVNIINGNILMDGGQLILSNEAIDSRTRRIILKDLRVRYIGDSYFPDALIKIPRCYDSFVSNCDIWPGVSTDLETDGPYIGRFKRARYGLWMGSKRAWGGGVIGGEYYGGENPLRFGYTNDHTGVTITGGTTIHHGSVVNLLLCNPLGFNIAGCNIEHSEDGAIGIGITSGTNADAGSTVINPAVGGKITGCYLFNNGNGTDGSTLAEAGILVGYDIPGTMGWDIEGYPITSQNTAHSITVENCYIVSPKQKYAVKMRGLSGLNTINNRYIYSSTVPVAFLYEGTCARSSSMDNRNQSTGVFDEVGYTSTSIPRIGKRTGTFLPTLIGATVAGSLTYSTRGGDYTIDDRQCSLSLWLNIGAVTTQPDGDLTIQLPIGIQSGRRSACALDLVNILGSKTINVNSPGSGTITLNNSILSGTALLLSGTTLRLKLANTNMQGAMVGVNTAITLSIIFPVDGAIYLG